MIPPGRSEGPKSFDDLAARAGPAAAALRELRGYCISLGPDTVEHVREHRVVFGRSMAMRWFADISWRDAAVVVRLNEGRRKDPTTVEVGSAAGMDAARRAISAAYSRL